VSPSVCNEAYTDGGGQFGIDKWGGPLLSIYLTLFHLAGSAIEAGSVTGHLRSYPVLVLGKVVAAVRVVFILRLSGR
jgi:hypothetical protein